MFISTMMMAKMKYPIAISGTRTALTFAIRWMPPKMMNKAMAERMTPITT